METIPDIFESFAAEQRDESVLITNTDKEPRPLFNGRQPSYVLKAERPEHRIIIMLKAAGRTNIEIAEATGTTPVHVAHIVKQPWAVEQILKEIENTGRQPVIEMLQDATVAAAQFQIDLLNDKEANKETRRKASDSILDRVLGKANQPFSVDDKRKPEDMTLEEIDKRLSELHAKQN
jgi:hypothetical protein